MDDKTAGKESGSKFDLSLIHYHVASFAFQRPAFESRRTANGISIV